MLAAVIFDMDGVIFDSEPLHYQVDQEMFADLGIEVSREEYEQYIGVSNTDMWSDVKKRYNLPQSVEELCQWELEENLQHLRENKEEPITGVENLLKELHDKNIKIALASSSPPAYIKLVISSLGLEQYFSEKVSGENVENGKPAPDIFLHTAELLQVSPDDTVVIEDSEHGVAAANEAGMICVGFKNENSGGQDLSQADIIVKDFQQLDFQKLQDLIGGSS